MRRIWEAARWVLPGMLIALGVVMALAAPAQAISAADLVNDDGGENDVDSSSLAKQTDLSAIAREGLNPGWTWDQPSLSGGNAQTVCGLYDDKNDDDTLTDYALCYQITYAGATPEIEVQGYSCSENASTGQLRCTSPNPELETSEFTADCPTATNVAARFGGDPDTDLQVLCTVSGSLADPNELQLTNICAYPGLAINSAPDDCGITPERAQITIAKKSLGGVGTFDFDPSVGENFSLTTVA
jgi:hypothetical protein